MHSLYQQTPLSGPVKLSWSALVRPVEVALRASFLKQELRVVHVDLNILLRNQLYLSQWISIQVALKAERV